MGMLAEGANPFPRVCIPEFEETFTVSCDEQARVWYKTQRGETGGPIPAQASLPRSDLPQPNSTVRASRGENLAVRREFKGRNGIVVRQRRDFLPGVELPDLGDLLVIVFAPIEASQSCRQPF